MKLKQLEVIKLQATAMNVAITIVNYDVNRYSVSIGKHVYTSFNNTLSAITTQFLKGK